MQLLTETWKGTWNMDLFGMRMERKQWKGTYREVKKSPGKWTEWYENGKNGRKWFIRMMTLIRLSISYDMNRAKVEEQTISRCSQWKKVYFILWISGAGRDGGFFFENGMKVRKWTCWYKTTIKCRKNLSILIQLAEMDGMVRQR